jgi:hypothetical protein
MHVAENDGSASGLVDFEQKAILQVQCVPVRVSHTRSLRMYVADVAARNVFSKTPGEQSWPGSPWQ